VEAASCSTAAGRQAEAGRCSRAAGDTTRTACTQRLAASVPSAKAKDSGLVTELVASEAAARAAVEMESTVAALGAPARPGMAPGFPPELVDAPKSAATAELETPRRPPVGRASVGIPPTHRARRSVCLMAQRMKTWFVVEE